MKEQDIVFNSRFYCPSCTGGGDLFVKDTNAYFNKNPYDYYCKKCKGTFKIEEIQ